MITFEIDGIATTIDRFEDKLHVRSQNLSAMLPCNGIRFQETERPGVCLLKSSSGEIEIMINCLENMASQIRAMAEENSEYRSEANIEYRFSDVDHSYSKDAIDEDFESALRRSD